jgi:hypothetical protein
MSYHSCLVCTLEGRFYFNFLLAGDDSLWSEKSSEIPLSLHSIFELASIMILNIFVVPIQFVSLLLRIDVVLWVRLYVTSFDQHRLVCNSHFR